MGDTPDKPPDYVLETMGIEQDKWESMTDEQRKEVAREFVKNANEALQEVREYLINEVIPPMLECARNIGDALVDVSNAIPEGAVNHSELSVNERRQIRDFQKAAMKYEQSRESINDE